MNAGYSAGWCKVSFAVELAAKEITSRAQGDEKCIFVVAPSKKLMGIRTNTLPSMPKHKPGEPIPNASDNQAATQRGLQWPIKT